MAAIGSISKLRSYWFTPVNNSPLIVFRMLFGAIMFMEFGSALTNGWVKQVFISAPFRFTFIGFEFLQHLDGPMMYGYYTVACILSALVAVGLFYRPAALGLALMWSAVYFAQKAHYNNHYYLMMLLCWLMAVVPANRRASFDVKFGLVKPTDVCARWCVQVFLLQTAIVYTYAAIAKIYPDWLNAMPVKIWFSNKTGHPYFGALYKSEWFAYFVAYSGFIFDLLVVPLLLWRRTRVLAVIAMLIFHQFNKLTFGIGVFPFLAMSLNVFFFPGKTFDNTVGIVKQAFKYPSMSVGQQRTITVILCLFLAWQVLTPFRHHFYKGDVVWTEEGHRMSWRMMLRTKSGDISYMVRDKASDSTWTIKPQKYMLRYQYRNLATRPDFIWQFAQRIERKYEQQGLGVAVYAKSICSVNGRPRRDLVDTSVDLAKAEWKHYAHNEWVLTDYK